MNSKLNTVNAVLESAGPPSNLNFLAGLAQCQPILTLPVVIQLQNPILGSRCFLGSTGNPIRL